MGQAHCAQKEEPYECKCIMKCLIDRIILGYIRTQIEILAQYYTLHLSCILCYQEYEIIYIVMSQHFVQTTNFDHNAFILFVFLTKPGKWLMGWLLLVQFLYSTITKA